MDDFTRIRTFIKVVEAGSFSAAARDNQSVSAIARQVKAIEDELGVRLLNRNTRNLALTDTGRRFYERVCAISKDLNSAKAEAVSAHETVKGPLRVSLRTTSGTTVVVPALPKFLAKYPDIELEVLLTDERKDLIANHIDVALWIGELPDAEIVARRLSPTQRVVCCAPEYIRRYGTPTKPSDLIDHNCIVFTAPLYSSRWCFSRDGQIEEVRVRGSVQTDNGMVFLASGLAGIGIISGNRWMVHNHVKAGRLVTILDEYTFLPRPGDSDLYAVYPSSRGLSRKVRAFVDFLIEAFDEAVQPPV
ncbi:MAG: LysR family transcriptional regulator [Hydrogenophaga sp.]|nr:LysR family transcriptional regulator [Hydrogenophaga sp.]